MFFTQDDYKKIEDWLHKRTVKDTQLPNATPLTGLEKVPILQNGKNKVASLDTFIKELSAIGLQDFINVTDLVKKGQLRLEEAINAVPVDQRKLGLVITFHSDKGNWMIYQFKGTSIYQWDSLNYWRSIIEEAIEGYLFFPDEEDITGVKDENRIFLKFKDKDYDPEVFSGMGRIILRKNFVGTEACSIDDEDHLNNILTQEMISEENTIYIVQYDFDLDGKTISIPKGCTLWFQGGSINNGTINVNEAAILGAFEFADMGDATLFGKFNTGQIMTFSDDSYQAKTGGYFIPSKKKSSATVEEDAKNEDEVFYEKNPDAYTTETRQELRWWNGEEWILILDITDYRELLSIIEDLIDKHNAEMSACYKYFKKRCYNLEVRMYNAEQRLDNHEKRITNIEAKITIIENDITNLKNSVRNLQIDVQNITNKLNEASGDIDELRDLINSKMDKTTFRVQALVAGSEPSVIQTSNTVTYGIPKCDCNGSGGGTTPGGGSESGGGGSTPQEPDETGGIYKLTLNSEDDLDSVSGSFSYIELGVSPHSTYIIKEDEQTCTIHVLYNGFDNIEKKENYFSINISDIQKENASNAVYNIVTTDVFTKVESTGNGGCKVYVKAAEDANTTTATTTGTITIDDFIINLNFDCNMNTTKFRAIYSGGSGIHAGKVDPAENTAEFKEYAVFITTNMKHVNFTHIRYTKDTDLILKYYKTTHFSNGKTMTFTVIPTSDDFDIGEEKIEQYDGKYGPITIATRHLVYKNTKKVNDRETFTANINIKGTNDITNVIHNSTAAITVVNNFEE